MTSISIQSPEHRSHLPRLANMLLIATLTLKQNTPPTAIMEPSTPAHPSSVVLAHIALALCYVVGVDVKYSRDETPLSSKVAQDTHRDLHALVIPSPGGLEIANRDYSDAGCHSHYQAVDCLDAREVPAWMEDRRSQDGRSVMAGAEC